MEFKKLLNQHLAEFEQYYASLVSFNEHTNLTAITEKNEVFVKHFLDSILPVDEIKKGMSVVDIGTGAGFPGLPLKIVRADIKLCLVDSLNKRINFLQEVCANLNLKTKLADSGAKTAIDFSQNAINLVHMRAEEFCANNREKFDVAVARAVAKLNTLLEYLLPLVKVGGIVLAYKGSNFEEELKQAKNAIKVLGGQYVKTLSFNLPNQVGDLGEEIGGGKSTLGERNIIVIKKISPTPKEFPRGQNKPKTKPII